jgi:hypothetical protein
MTTFNKRSSLTVILFAVAGLAGLMLARAGDAGGGETTTGASTETISEELAAQLAAIEQLPTIDPTNVPDGLMGGTYFSAQFPTWAPLPANIFHVPVWSLGDNYFLLDDLGLSYGGPTEKAAVLHIGTGRNDSTKGGVGADYQTQSGIPYLVIAPTGTNGIVEITVLNNEGPANYEIWTTPVLGNADYPWTAIAAGTTGTTNFYINLGEYYTGFYQAIWDTNAIPVWEAANMNNPSAGILTVYIDSPTNGAVLQ